MENKKLNIYQKIQMVKTQILRSNLKKSGKNKFAWFDYYELSDIIPTIIELCNQYQLFTHITFTNEEAVLSIIDAENPESLVQYKSPMRDLELKWCNQIQSLWGVETYQRRYLYLNCFDICESELFDAVTWDESKEEKKTTNRFNKEHLEKLSQNKEYLEKFATSDDLIKDIQKKYAISKEMRMKIADVRAK
jgi:hypothetical protein